MSTESFWASHKIKSVSKRDQPGNPTASSENHPGFKGVQDNVMNEGYSKQAAGAIVASAARKASPAAKKANPNLSKVTGA